MSAKDEILVYLQSLLAHHATCKVEQCSGCLALQGILESVQRRIFSGPVFPEVMMAERDVLSSKASPIGPPVRRAPSPRRQKVRGGALPSTGLPELNPPVREGEAGPSEKPVQPAV